MLWYIKLDKDLQQLMSPQHIKTVDSWDYIDASSIITIVIYDSEDNKGTTFAFLWLSDHCWDLITTIQFLYKCVLLIFHLYLISESKESQRSLVLDDPQKWLKPADVVSGCLKLVMDTHLAYCVRARSHARILLRGKTHLAPFARSFQFLLWVDN